ncbi:MAG TPA: hypothetical protein VKQ08_11650 [Cyclobacteriaceae bacterium]|nr:hypothetical protein [Cyclobacteriaceae bacterium]
MKRILGYFWILVLLLAVHGSYVVRSEWKIKSIHQEGELVEVKIEALNCQDLVMSFRFRNALFQKKIDARTCVTFNPGQSIKLRRSERYADTFLFVNERNPNRFMLGGLEILIGLLGFLANWPLVKFKSAAHGSA